MEDETLFIVMQYPAGFNDWGGAWYLNPSRAAAFDFFSDGFSALTDVPGRVGFISNLYVEEFTLTIPEGYYWDISHDGTTDRVWWSAQSAASEEGVPTYYYLADDGGVYHDDSLCTLWKAVVMPTPVGYKTPSPTPSPSLTPTPTPTPVGYKTPSPIPFVRELEGELSGLPTQASNQGVATDGTYFYVLTSKNTSYANENIIRKYRISDKALVLTKNDAYATPYAFSSGNVINGKLYVAVRTTDNNVWNHIAEYQLSDLTLLDDHDVSLTGYRYAEGVDGYDGYFWVMYGGVGNEPGGGNNKCAVGKFNSSWVHQTTYDLFTNSGVNNYGYQDIVWVGDNIYGNIHTGNADVGNTFDRLHWNGSAFHEVASYVQFSDNAEHEAGQGFCRLDGYWYFACRYSDRIVKAILSPTPTSTPTGTPTVTPTGR
jgi:hypothetical protein